MRAIPDGLVTKPETEVDLGTLKSGKEAQINIVEWTDLDGNTSVVARKRYLPREVKENGTLEALGVQRATAFRKDVEYREGRQFRKSRDRRAIEKMTEHGKRLLQDRWTGHEFEVMTTLWDAGVPVPYPISYAGDLFHLEYLGSLDGAAPQLAVARLDRPVVPEVWDQIFDGLRTITEVGYAHGDLSAYNLLWWQGRVWFIDFPQAVDIAENPQGLNYLHRDVVNICTWCNRKGMDLDPEEVFADLLTRCF